jgi:hypothetical protein
MIPSIALFARSVCDRNHRRQIMSIFSPGIAALDLPLISPTDVKPGKPGDGTVPIEKQLQLQS